VLLNFIMSLGLSLMACVVQIVCNIFCKQKKEINGKYIFQIFGLFIICFFIFNIVDLI
jgi:heme/copper-type cytochrome/quinol oxidase subunit 4